MRSRIKSKLAFGTVLVAAMVAATSGPAKAFPDKELTVLVGFPPGGGIDAYARAVGKFAEKHLGQPFVIQYKKGGGGRLALNQLNKGDFNDGYTIAATLLPNFMIGSLAQPENKRGYALDDFTMLGTHACVPSAWLVKAGSPHGSLADAIAFAKSNAGKLTVSVNGATSGTNAFRMVVENATGIQVQPIVYKGGAAALKAVLGGEVQVMSSNSNWIQRYPDQVSGLMVAGSERYKLTPDVPTLKEMGYDIVDCLARAMSVPKGVPADRLAALRDGMAKIAADPDFHAEMEKIGLVADWWDHAKTRQFIDDYVANNQFIFDAMLKKK